MRTHLRLALSTLAMVAALGGAMAQPTWYPPTEPSPFIPDAAHWVVGKGGKTMQFRGTWDIKGPVKRAVLMVAPSQTTRLYLNGRLTLEAYDPLQALPAWAEGGDRLQPGKVFVAARVYSEWRPALYSQMRVEYADGTVEDLTTKLGWEWCEKPGDDWATNPQAAGDWQPVEESGGYGKEGSGVWGQKFALLPRDMLRERLEAHNARLRKLWETDRTDPGLQLTEAPDRPEWAAQFAKFCTLGEDGQVVDGAGKARHLFFTIYTNGGSLSADSIDFDQYERDLDLMAKADTHLYMRNMGWCWLLTKDGEWAPLAKQPKGTNLPHFDRGIDLLDYFVKRAWAHGRYIVFEGDFFWAAHADVVPAPYRTRFHIYPEVLEAEALAMRRAMSHFRGCTSVLGMMIGEEDIALEHDLQNPHQHALFADYLKRKYGTLERFKQETRWGCDYSDRSAYYTQKRQAEYWPGQPAEDVLVPRHPVREGVFDKAKDWLDIPLPMWPAFRSVQEPGVALNGWKSYNEFTPDDPLWIDFYEMREDELLFGMLKRWAEIVRPAIPNQLLFYSNAQDFTNSWHFLHLYRRYDLPFDVIGVGCHDADQNLSEIPAWATQRKSIKVVSSYRPYVLSPGSPSRGVAAGEGQGGKPKEPQEILNYFRGTVFDEIGGGCAWTQTYTWDHISGGAETGTPHESPLLQWFSEFMPAVQGVRFPLRRPVQVLIVRNTNLAHTNMSGLDYGNVQVVAEALTQLNVEFDIVMDRDLVPATEGAKPVLDLAKYRLVILPCEELELPDRVMKALVEGWLSDPAFAGQRVLAQGRVGTFGPHLQPLGGVAYQKTVNLQGKQDLKLLAGGKEQALSLDMGHIPPTGIIEQGEPFLQTAAGDVIAARTPVGGNAVVMFGYSLGLAHEPLWGMGPEQSPRDAALPIYEALAKMAGIDRPILAPHNLRVYVAEGGKMILIRERAGLKTDAEVGVRVPEGVSYPGLTLERKGDGYARFKVSLEAWDGKWWKAEG